jgi:hypothetical protein
MNAIGNIVGLFVFLAIVATLAAKPQIITSFFGGIATATKAAKA